MAAPPDASHAAFPVGSEVVLCNMQSNPQLNGLRGRVLPPLAGDSPGRVRVETSDGQKLALRSTALLTWPPDAPPTGALADLVRADVLQGEVPLRISRASLRGSGLEERLIRCSRCGDAACSHYLALERTAPLRSAPLPREKLQLCCCDCLIRAAQAAGVPPEPKAVTRFVDACCMGAMQACSQLMGHARVGFGGAMGSGALY